jgi:hypothetical protein
MPNVRQRMMAFLTAATTPLALERMSCTGSQHAYLDSPGTVYLLVTAGP